MIGSKRISVITVNWNGRKWLKRYLDSVFSQTYKNIEVIVVDNASSDGSVNFVKKNYPKTKIIQNRKNYGLAKATNIGVKKSTAELILFINNDTWFEKDFIEKLINFYSQNNYAVLSAREERYFSKEKFKCNTTIDPTGSPAYYVPTYSRPEKIFYLTVCFLCSKQDYVDSKGVDSDFFMYYEDVDWFWRLTLMGKKFAVAKNCVIHHAGAGSTGEGIKYNFFLWRNQNTLQSLIKNYSTPSLLLVLPFYLLQNLFEILFFLCTLKPKIASTYPQGWYFNLKYMKRTLRKRQWVQKQRTVNDFLILRKMYFGFGKLLLLKDYLKI